MSVGLMLMVLSSIKLFKELPPAYEENVKKKPENKKAEHTVVYQRGTQLVSKREIKPSPQKRGNIIIILLKKKKNETLNIPDTTTNEGM